MKASNKSQVGDSGFIPKGIWPGAFGVYSYSKKLVEYNAGAFVPVMLASYILDLIASFSSTSLIKFLFYIIILLLELASYTILLASLQHRKVTIAEALDEGTRAALKVFAVYVIMIVAVMVGLVCLIIPGLLILPRLTLAPFYVLDQNLSIQDAIVTSWKNSEGHSTKIWGVIAVQLLFAVLAIILIGIYFSIIYTGALIILYKYVNANPQVIKE